MFGYVRPLVGELKVSEYNYYKSAYCGVCKSMGKECGAFSRFCLSYDSAFLSLLLCAVRGEKNKPEAKRCPVNPAAKRPMLCGSACIAYSAAACGVLAAFGFADGAEDERGLRRLAALSGVSVSKPWLKKVSENYPGLCEGVAERLNALYAAEKEAKDTPENLSLDLLADRFGDVLAFVCSYPFDSFAAEDGAADRRAICSNIGHHVGRWIYCIDAIDDLKEDEKRGRFNPFLLAYGRAEFSEEEKVTLRCLLGGEAGAASLALELCESGEEASREPLKIVENVLNFGMPDTAAAVISGKYRKPGRDRI